MRPTSSGHLVETWPSPRGVPVDWPGDDCDTGARDELLEPEVESDTEDFAHDGNGAPCKFHNGNGCSRGKRCQFRHAPDARSVRDELCVPTISRYASRRRPLKLIRASRGRNVCLCWLVGECVPAKRRTQCGYAHDATYLPAKGWWKDSGRLGRLREEFSAAVKHIPLPGRSGARENILAEALRPAPWRNDLWATAPSCVAEDDDDGSEGDGDYEY